MEALPLSNDATISSAIWRGAFLRFSPAASPCLWNNHRVFFLSAFLTVRLESGFLPPGRFQNGRFDLFLQHVLHLFRNIHAFVSSLYWIVMLCTCSWFSPTVMLYVILTEPSEPPTSACMFFVSVRSSICPNGSLY